LEESVTTLWGGKNRREHIILPAFKGKRSPSSPRRTGVTLGKRAPLPSLWEKTRNLNGERGFEEVDSGKEKINSVPEGGVRDL